MNRNEELFARAERVIPGGVNSPVRAFRSVGGTPIFASRAKGQYLWDENGKRYTDYIGSWGPLILGHSYEPVVEAVVKAAENGASFGLPTEAEVEMAELVCSLVPGVEMVRMVSSGTEAVLSALRVARGFTGREVVVKFEGCYHGHSDSMLVKAGSGLATAGQPDSAGVTRGTAATTLTCAYNDANALERIFAEHGEHIAAVIVEPVAANMGVVLPDGDVPKEAKDSTGNAGMEVEYPECGRLPEQKGFLERVREITQRYGALLIFDEVITGFRLGIHCASGYYGITPDLSTFGKIIGGGLPVGAYGGRRDVMSCVAPLGPVYQAGTLSGNPIAMAAGLATLNVLRGNPNIYRDLNYLRASLGAGLAAMFAEKGVRAFVQGIESLATVFFTKEPVFCYADAKKSDTARYARFFNGMLARGVLMAPSQFEAMFLSAAHTAEDVSQFLDAAQETINSDGF